MKIFYRSLTVFFLLLLYSNSFAQYNGGDGSGSVLDTAYYNTCNQTPLSFYAYFGGNGGGASLDTANYSTCSQTPLSFYAYFGGNGGEESMDTANYSICSQTPLAYYAYFGGNGDGESIDTVNYSPCSQTPLAYYAYFGGNGDGYALEERIDICPFVKPVANFSANHTSVCIGDSVYFTNHSTYSPNTLNWLFEGGMPGTSSAVQPHVSYSTIGSYKVTLIATNNMGVDTLIKTSYITVNAIPTAIITSNDTNTFCQGDSVRLTSNTATSYLWSNGATTQSITAFSSENYSVTVYSSNGCSATSTPTTVTVNPLPVAIITPSGATTFCQGNSVTLTVGSAASYLWSTGATTQSITVSSSENDSVTVTNANGCSTTSSPVRVTVNSNPVIPNITASDTTTFCQGNSVTLTASSANSYLWSTGAATQNITVSTSGNYSVTVYNSSGCSATSSSTTVTVNPTPIATITSSGATSFCQGDSATLTASFANSYLWSNGATTQSIIVTVSDNYSVTLMGSYGCSATSSVTTVTVNPLPPTPTISANGTTLTSGNSTGNQWYMNGISISGATSQTYSVTQNGNYTVCYTDGNGCSATSTPYNFFTVGIQELNSTNVLIIPNPNNGIFRLETTNMQLSEIKIFNSIGEIIYQSEINNPKSEIDLADQSNGIYFIHISSENGSVIKKIVINK